MQAAAIALITAATAAALDEVVRLPKVAMAAAADLAGAHVHPTRVSHVRTQVTAKAVGSHQASHGKRMHRASATHKRPGNTANNSDRTRAARVWIHALSHEATLTIASLAVTFRLVSPLQVNPQVATVAASAAPALAAVVAVEQAVAADGATARAAVAVHSAVDKIRKRAHGALFSCLAFLQRNTCQPEQRFNQPQQDDIMGIASVQGIASRLLSGYFQQRRWLVQSGQTATRCQHRLNVIAGSVY